MISGSTVWNFIRNVYDWIIDAISDYPQVVFWMAVGVALLAAFA